MSVHSFAAVPLGSLGDGDPRLPPGCLAVLGPQLRVLYLTSWRSSWLLRPLIACAARLFVWQFVVLADASTAIAIVSHRFLLFHRTIGITGHV